jgi:transposase-like protein
MAENTTPQTLQPAIRYYSDTDVCRRILVEARWPDGVKCPYCGSDDVAYLPNQRRWRCRKGKHDRRQFSVKVGTIFEDSPLGLDKWFTAVWLIAGAKNGISSYELHRAIGVTQKSAWFMLHRIRLAMQTGTFAKLSGRVEADETFIGGKARNMHKDRKDRVVEGRESGYVGKVAVMGLLERCSDKGQSVVRTEVVQNTDLIGATQQA